MCRRQQTLFDTPWKPYRGSRLCCKISPFIMSPLHFVTHLSHLIQMHTVPFSYSCHTQRLPATKVFLHLIHFNCTLLKTFCTSFVNSSALSSAVVSSRSNQRSLLKKCIEAQYLSSIHWLRQVLDAWEGHCDHESGALSLIVSFSENYRYCWVWSFD